MPLARLWLLSDHEVELYARNVLECASLLYAQANPDHLMPSSTPWNGKIRHHTDAWNFRELEEMVRNEGAGSLAGALDIWADVSSKVITVPARRCCPCGMLRTASRVLKYVRTPLCPSFLQKTLLDKNMHFSGYPAYLRLGEIPNHALTSGVFYRLAQPRAVAVALAVVCIC